MTRKIVNDFNFIDLNPHLLLRVKDEDFSLSEFETMMNNINNKYGLSVEKACDINNIKAEFEKAIQQSKSMLESE